MNDRQIHRISPYTLGDLKEEKGTVDKKEHPYMKHKFKNKNTKPGIPFTESNCKVDLRKYGFVVE